MKNYLRLLALYCLASSIDSIQAQAPVDPFAPVPAASGNMPVTMMNREAIEKKLREIVIPAVELPGVPLDVAIEFIQTRASELDRSENPESRGINIVLRPEPKNKVDRFAPDPEVTIDLRNATLGMVLAATAKHLGKEVWIENRAVVLGAAKQKPDPNVKQPEIPMVELQATRIPSMEFNNTPLDTCLDILQSRYRELAAKNGEDLTVTLVGEVKIGDTFGESFPRVDLRLQNVSIYDAFAHVAAQAGLRLEILAKEVRLVGPTQNKKE